MLTPKEVLLQWIDAFNRADADALSELYDQHAINHQVANQPVTGQQAIREWFLHEFSTVKMVCIPEKIFVDGDHAILEWVDPNGLRGCGFFTMKEGKIIFQRGYWDKLSFLKANHLPLPEGDYAKPEQDLEEEGCSILEILNNPLIPAVSLARARVLPGKTTEWHYLLGTREWYLILEGTGLMEVQGREPRSVAPEDSIDIPPGTPQRITNTGTTDLIFYAVCAPRFVKENFKRR
jgi:mannose-6-phosphate isomerase-like protein (cupin superfamily)